jgi:glyoxylase-like metal-dependent hydrolase (beta-lactamase superfamily II)
MKRLLKYLAIGLLVLILIPVIALAITFSGNPEVKDGLELGGFARTIKDGYVSLFVLDTGDGRVALIDAGNDPEGKAIFAELARRQVGPEAVSAIFLTHGHPDHVAAATRFPGAQIYALESEVPLVEGRAGASGPMTRFMPVKETGIRVTHPLKDGETVTVGQLPVTAFATPGQTGGSAVYLARGVLFFGDSADATKDGRLVGAKYIFSDDTAQNAASLKRLVAQLGPRAGEISALAFAHTGALTGFKPLADFAALP